MTSVSPGDGAGHAGGAQSQGFSSQTAEFFLQNYRLGKTLGIGSFGKVGAALRGRAMYSAYAGCQVPSPLLPLPVVYKPPFTFLCR